MSYQGRRVMRARNARLHKEGWLEAAVQLDPAGGFTYRIAATGGSPLVVNRVLIAALQGEADMWRSGEPARSAVTPENYTFVEVWPIARDGRDEMRIVMAPRRKHVLLVDGRDTSRRGMRTFFASKGGFEEPVVLGQPGRCSQEVRPCRRRASAG